MSVRNWLVGIVASLGIACSVTVPDDGVESTGSVRQANHGLGTLTTDKGSYTAGEPVIASWTNLHGNYYDWIAIAAPGSPNASYVTYLYTQGGANGSRTFSTLPAGTYVARAFDDNGYTLMAESAQFTVAPGAGTPTVTTNAATYTPQSTAVVSFTNMAGYQYDWISIAAQGATAADYVRWAYTNSQLNGSVNLTLTGLAGTYVARAHFNNENTIRAESAPFTVAAAGTTVTTDKTSYAFEEPVTVSWTNMQGDAKDWISIAPQGSSLDTFTWWEYTEGGFSGQYVRPGSLPPGTFVARAFFADTVVLRAESQPFTVAAPASQPVTLSTDKASYGGLETVQVSFSGMAGGDPASATDWVGVYEPHGDMYRFRGWAYTGGATAGTVGVWPLRFGTWVVRGFYNDNYFMKGQTASTITVVAGVTTDKPTYTTADTITVRFGGMIARSFDFVALASAGTPAGSYTLWKYTNARAGGTVTFPASQLGPGSYVARAFFDSETTPRAEGGVFTIQ